MTEICFLGFKFGEGPAAGCDLPCLGEGQVAAGGEEASFFIHVFALLPKFASNCCKTLEKEKFPRPTPTSLG